MKIKERRQHHRFRIYERATVELKKSRRFKRRNHVLATGSLYDISFGGVSVIYNDPDLQLIDISKITIINEREAVKIIRNIPVRSISQTKLKKSKHKRNIIKCGLEFGQLSDYHKSCLNLLLSAYDGGISPLTNEANASSGYDEQDGLFRLSGEKYGHLQFSYP